MSRSAVAWKRRRFAAIFVGMFGAVAVLPALPWLMGIVGDVRHSYTPTVPAENKGAYLVTGDGAMELFAWDIDPGDFPRDAPTLDARKVDQIVVVQRAFDAVDRYVLYDLDAHRRVPWANTGVDGNELRLRWAGTLDAGRYLLLAPTDSSFGGVRRHYFRIRQDRQDGRT